MPLDDTGPPAAVADAVARPLLVTPATVLLLQAEKRLRPWRWCKGAMDDKGRFRTRHCVVGALEWASRRFELDEEPTAFDAARDALDAEAVRRGYRDAATFNDHPATRLRDVHALLRDAAERAKAPVADAGAS